MLSHVKNVSIQNNSSNWSLSGHAFHYSIDTGHKALMPGVTLRSGHTNACSLMPGVTDQD